MFNEAFTGYGKNKIEHIMLLRAKGFKFSVLPRVFSVHLPHPKSKAKRQWDDEKKGKNEKLLLETKSDLSSRKNNTPLCKASKRVTEMSPDVWLASVETARAKLKALESGLGRRIADGDLVVAPSKSDRRMVDAVERSELAKKELSAMRKYERTLDLDGSIVHEGAIQRNLLTE